MLKRILFCIIIVSSYFQSFAQPLPIPIPLYDSIPPEGYYFVCIINRGAVNNMVTKKRPALMILDGKGKVICAKMLANSGVLTDFKLQKNGNMSYCFRNRFFIVDSTFKIIDTVSCTNKVMNDMHDIKITRKGNYLLLGHEKSYVDWEKCLFTDYYDTTKVMFSAKVGVIQEISPNKELLFEWHSKEHMNLDDLDERYINNHYSFEFNHFNSLDEDYDGNILVSSRYLNEITKIDRVNKNIIWRLGGKRNQFRFLNDTCMFVSQHDINRLPNGNISLFDNGIDSNPIHPASAKEYKIDVTNKTAELVWKYTYDSTRFSHGAGNVVRYPGKYTLVNFGRMDSVKTAFTLVNDSGKILLSVAFKDLTMSYRAFFYPEISWKIPRPKLRKYKENKEWFLDAGAGFVTYLWENGETTQRIKVSKNGNYSVLLENNDNLFLRSEEATISDLSN